MKRISTDKNLVAVVEQFKMCVYLFKSVAKI
jgi:hypothetical protein